MCCSVTCLEAVSITIINIHHQFNALFIVVNIICSFMCLEAVPPKEGWQIFTFLIRIPRSGQGDGVYYVDDDNDDDVVDDNDNVDVDGDDDDVQASRITNGG